MSFNLTQEGRKAVEDYVLKMLGAPVVKVELDPQHLTFVVDESTEFVKTWLDDIVKARNSRVITNLINRGALIYAKVILGRIRSKYTTVPSVVANEKNSMDGDVLLAEARADIGEWREAVKYFARYGLGSKE